MRTILLIILSTLLVAVSFAGTITGKVTSKASGDPLAGANVFLQGWPVGAATDESGVYSFDVKDGTYVLKCEYVGFAEQSMSITVSGSMTRDFELVEYLFAKTINVVADRAKERETPVAYSNVSKERMELTLASQDIPMVLNTTPSVYSTMSGGGAGDARINIRGFDQRNVAVMINGMPVNDMENGWVYWSNWDGIGDATSSIQVQRGLSAVNLATPSVGGTMNIITDPTAHDAKLLLRQEFGNEGFLKTSFTGHSGLIDDKWAVSATVVRKSGDGLIDGAWIDAWAYYFGASWNINDDNRLELYAMGAPQRHGQNLYKQNIAAYDYDYAKDLDDYNPVGFEDYAEQGLKYNQNWGPVSSSYTSKQYFNGSEHERYDPNFMMERENFFHKPLANLNWYSQFSDKVSLYTVAYWSGGKGGGTGTLGSVSRNWAPHDGKGPWVWDWNKEIADNRANAEDGDGSGGILRNSVNNQWTAGLLAKLYWKLNQNLTLSFGLDGRKAELDHFREVRDLLGGIYFDPRDRDDVGYSDFWSESEYRRVLGDKVDYNFTNTVDWTGAYVQGEYTVGKWTVAGVFGWSQIKYSYVNHFKTAEELPDGSPDLSSGELKTDAPWVSGYQLKGGASYRISENIDVFGNFGLISKVPIFDVVIDDADGELRQDPTNETITHFELGLNQRTDDGRLMYKASAYYTIWNDHALNTDVEIGDEEQPGELFMYAIDQRHLGLELELVYNPIPLLRFDLSGSVANWIYTDDAKGKVKNYANPDTSSLDVYAIKDLKVGDAPQIGATLGISVLPAKGLTLTLLGAYYTNYWSQFDPFDRTIVGTPDRTQSWKIPNYLVFNFHGMYEIPVNWNGIGLGIFAHVLNIFDTKYILEAVDNSQYNGAGEPNHSSSSAEVFFGRPLQFNIGLQLTY